jgi:hypothetical protein
MPDACHRHAAIIVRSLECHLHHLHCAIFVVLSLLCYLCCAIFVVPSSLYHLHCAISIVPSPLCHLHCAIFIVPSLYVVGSIAFGRRSSAVLAIIATLQPSELLLTSWLGHRSLAC